MQKKNPLDNDILRSNEYKIYDKA